jgi:transposase-like protein
MNKVRPSETKSNEFEEVANGSKGTKSFITDFVQAAAEKLLQEILEHEVSDFLGRDWYERRESSEPTGYRNGYLDKRFKTANGTFNVKRPRVRDTEQPFESRILERLDGIDERLSKLTVELYVRGLSTRDIEQALVDEDGKPLLSRNAVSQLTVGLSEEYEQFVQTDLSALDVVYVYMDAVYESIRSYTHNQAVFCAWAVCSDGRKVMLHLAVAASESQDAWEGFIDDMLNRGLRQPLLVISDGGKGLIAATERKFPQSDRQRCLAHKLRNLATKVPKDVVEEVLTAARGVYYAPDLEAGQLLAKRFVETYSRFPALVKCFLEDVEACLVQLKYPQGHRKYIRTTNLIERSFEEVKRRTKVIPTHINEFGAMKLVFGALIRASFRWYRVQMNDLDLARLRQIRMLVTPRDTEHDQISFKLTA